MALLLTPRSIEGPILSAATVLSYTGGVPPGGVPQSVRDRLVFTHLSDKFALWSDLSVDETFEVGGSARFVIEYGSAEATAGKTIQWKGGIATPDPGTNLSTLILGDGGQGGSIDRAAAAPVPTVLNTTLFIGLALTEQVDMAPDRSMIVWVGREPAHANDNSDVDAWIESVRVEFDPAP